MGILVAPIILVDDWKNKYEKLFIFLNDNLSDKAKKKVFFEFILMTYSYVHKMINSDAFPNAIDLYDKNKMNKLYTEQFGAYSVYASNSDTVPCLQEWYAIYFIMRRFFPNNEIKYMV